MDQIADDTVLNSFWLRCPWTPGFNALLKFSKRHETCHLRWYLPYVEEFRKDQLCHLGEVVYLDYAGAALFSRAQLAATQEMLLQSCLGNPHSSRSSEEMVERSRDLVLHLFKTTRKTHSVIFTSGATQSLQLLGEHYPWKSTSTGGCFLYADESHTSVLGLRQFARAANWAFGTFALDDLPRLAKDISVAKIIEGCMAHNEANLLAIPGESNFSGLKPNLACLTQLRHGGRWRILLDAAKLACSPGVLDLSECCADFTVISFYKIFGHPTGLGALLVRHDAAPLLLPRMDGNLGSGPTVSPSYFAGGTVSSISALSSFVVAKPSLSEWLERGTSHFQGILSLPAQVKEVNRLGSEDARHHHALAVCHEAYIRTSHVCHSNGRKVSHIFGDHGLPNWEKVQGPTLTLLLYYADGSPVPYGLVANHATERQILLRTGCHCNAGACQRYLDLTDEDIRGFFANGKVCGDDRGVIDGRPTGVIRLSFGLYSTMSDVDRWIDLLLYFVDRHPEEITERKSLVKSVPKSMPMRGSISALKVYPVKGCGPLHVKRWPMDSSSDGALFLDRRWCLTLKSKQRPVSAKQAPRLTNVRLSLKQQASCYILVLSSKFHPKKLEILLSEEDSQILLLSGVQSSEVPIENERTTDTVRLEDALDASWFEQLLEIQGLQLLPATNANGGTGEAPAAPQKTDFANAPQTVLMVSTASLKKFGELCGLGAVPAERFRGNLEVTFPDDKAYEEMTWANGLVLQVGSDTFEVVGRCIRCQAIDIDPEDAESHGPSLLAALATAQRDGVAGSTGKGPTFGVLLRKHQWQKLPVLEIGMSLHTA